MDPSKSIRDRKYSVRFVHVTRDAARAKRHLVKAQFALAELQRCLSHGQSLASASQEWIPLDEVCAEHAACDAIIADLHRQTDRVTRIETNVAKLRQWKGDDNE